MASGPSWLPLKDLLHLSHHANWEKIEGFFQTKPVARKESVVKSEPNSQPTKPELAILKLLWQKRRLSAREIADEISPVFDWSYSTMRTVLERMVEKGLLGKDQQGSLNLYTPQVGKIALLSRMIRDFSDRVLELDAAPSAVMFADSKLLTDEEIEELERVLREGETN